MICVLFFGWVVESEGLMIAFVEKQRRIGGLDGFSLHPFERRE